MRSRLPPQPVIQISTDYVFDGSKPEPWTEADTPAPVSVYGASKLAGERAVLDASPRNLIIRGRLGLQPVRRQLYERDVLRVVADQVGSPSSALDIADGVFTVARNVLTQPDRDDLRGVFDMGAGGEARCAEFAG